MGNTVQRNVVILNRWKGIRIIKTPLRTSGEELEGRD
jgi:hypothetical protein